MSVEDIERNIRSQQQMQQNQDQIVKPPTPQLHQMMQQQQQQQQQFQRPTAPPGLALPKPPLGPPLNMQLPPGLQKPPHQRLPPGFPPMNMLNQNIPGLPPSLHANMGRPMPPNVPIPMPGNFPVSADHLVCDSAMLLRQSLLTGISRSFHFRCIPVSMQCAPEHHCPVCPA